MALQKVYTKSIFGNTLTFEQAYFMISPLNGNKESLSMALVVYDTSKKENVLDRLSFMFSPNIADDAKNFYKQGYEYLKTLLNFSDATDVLESSQVA